MQRSNPLRPFGPAPLAPKGALDCTNLHWTSASRSCLLLYLSDKIFNLVLTLRGLCPVRRKLPVLARVGLVPELS